MRLTTYEIKIITLVLHTVGQSVMLVKNFIKELKKHYVVIPHIEFSQLSHTALRNASRSFRGDNENRRKMTQFVTKILIFYRLRVVDPQDASLGANETVYNRADQKAPVDGS